MLVVFVAIVTASAVSGYTERDEGMTVTSPSEIVTASDGFPGDGFGIAVDVDGDVMVVGAIGAAYVFTRSSSRWLETAKLTVANSPPGWSVVSAEGGEPESSPVEGREIRLSDAGTIYGGFGRAVAVDGDVIVVGAYEAAHVFSLVEGEWTETTKLTGSDDLSGLGLQPDGSRLIATRIGSGFLDGGFGSSVAVDGDVVVVGANGIVGRHDFVTEESSRSEEYLGSAYVYTRSGGQWSEAAKLIRPGEIRDRNFGRDVAIDGDVLVVASNEVAFVYEKAGSGWVESSHLAASGNLSNSPFGPSVAVWGQAIIVSEIWEAQVHERTADGWALEFADQFGEFRSDVLGGDVDLEDGIAVVVPLEDDFEQSTNPMAFSLFDRSRNGWRSSYEGYFPDPGWRPQSVALGGGTLAVGAHLSYYLERAEGDFWQFAHFEPGAVYTYSVKVLYAAGDGSVPTATAVPVPTVVSTATAVPVPTVVPTATAVVAASLVLVDDEDSPGGGINPVWAAVIIAELALIVVAIAYFLIRRRPADDTGRYTT